MSCWAPHSVSLRQLQYVVALAEHLSFRRAAEACHVSQPSLSAQVAQVEEALGVQLFERDRRQVLATPAGQDLIARARKLLVEADELAEAARRHRDPHSGTLRLGVIPTIAPYLLPVATPLLRTRHARLSVLWIEEKTAVLAERLAEGALEGALVALGPDLGDVESAVIAEDGFVLAAGAKDPLGRGATPLRLADLRGREVLLLDEGHCLRAQALPICSAGGARASSFRATSLPTLAQMVAGGNGITLLPRLAVSAEQRRSAIAVRAFAAPEPSRTLALVWRRKSAFAAVLQPLAETLRQAYAAAGAQAAPPRARRRG